MRVNPDRKRTYESKYDRQDILSYIIHYKSTNDGIPPTVREIAEEFQIPSTSNVQYILSDMERRGMIILEGHRQRRIKIPGGQWSKSRKQQPETET